MSSFNPWKPSFAFPLPVMVFMFFISYQTIVGFETVFLQDTKALVTIAILIGLFCVCFIPIFVASIIEKIAKVYIDEKVLVVLKFLHFSNSGLNPVVYAWRNPELARAIKKLLCWQPTREANTSVTALERGREKRMTPSTISWLKWQINDSSVLDLIGNKDDLSKNCNPVIHL